MCYIQCPGLIHLRSFAAKLFLILCCCAHQAHEDANRFPACFRSLPYVPSSSNSFTGCYKILSKDSRSTQHVCCCALKRIIKMEHIHPYQYEKTVFHPDSDISMRRILRMKLFCQIQEIVKGLLEYRYYLVSNLRRIKLAY